MPPARRPRFARRRVRPARQPSNRRGATLAIVAVLLVPLLGFAAVAVDASWLFTVRTQLQTVADAAAHAAVVEIAADRKAAASDAALATAAQNVANQSTATVAAADVVPGRYDPAASPTFTAYGSWTDPNVNAARVVSRSAVSLFFARVLNINSSNVNAEAIAAVGSQTATGCAKPWAIPYEALLWAAGRANTNDHSPLTPAEVDYLSDTNREIMFKSGPGDQAIDVATGTKIPGNFRAVDFPVYRYENGQLNPGYKQGGADDYRDWIGSTACGNFIKVGDWLMTQTGNMPGPTKQGMHDLCGGTANGNNGGTCSPAYEVILPVWNNPPAKAGATEVQINYVGAFKMTRWDKDGNVYGHFDTAKGGGGGFSILPGPVTRIALVK